MPMKKILFYFNSPQHPIKPSIEWQTARKLAPKLGASHHFDQSTHHLFKPNDSNMTQPHHP
jgi:hypothetical protein